MGKEKKKGGKGAGDEDVKGKQVLQAVLLADSFKKTFRPITVESPTVLLPLVNVPMLEYTIEFLAQSGVEELFIYCVKHASIITKYLSTSRGATVNMKVRCIPSSACLSAGDALRELDAMGVIRSDPFILISGDVISNMDLRKAIEFHKERRKVDADAIMTVVFKDVKPSGGIRPIADDLIVALDSDTSQLVMYDDSNKKECVQLPTEIIEEHPRLLFRNNLLDCHIDICSPEFLVQFSDNFDYQDVRRHFIRNETVNWELGSHMYAYILDKEYAARVHDARTYHNVCHDIVRRWCYPMVPEANMLPGTTYKHTGRYIYKEDQATVARSAFIGDGVVLGKGAIIEEDAVVKSSIVGRNCIIRKGAVVEESHLWEGCQIGEGAKVNCSIVCDGAKISKNATIGRGCFISFGVQIGESIEVAEYSRITLVGKTAGSDSEDEVDDDNYTNTKGELKGITRKAEATEYDKHIIGVDGEGCAWIQSESDSDSSEDEATDAASPSDTLKVSALRSSSMGCREEEEWKRRRWRVLSLVDDELSDTSDDEDEPEDFEQTVKDIVLTGDIQGDNAQNITMEIKSVKFAQNKEFSDCIRGVVPALLQIAIKTGEGTGEIQSSKAIISKLKPLLTEGGWGYMVLRPLIQEKGDEGVLIGALEDLAVESDYSNVLAPIFRFILQMLHDSDLLTDTSLLEWAELRASSQGCSEAKMSLFLTPAVQAFVAWIKEDDEEESDEDDDDDDDDDDDETDEDDGDS
jgi:translation initiation factor eIF-2B subunit epsilon